MSREPDALWEQALQEQEYEEFTVEVQRTVCTTVRIRAKNALSAARIADDPSYPLPPGDDADADDWHYTVFNASGGQLYSGDALDLT